MCVLSRVQGPLLLPCPVRDVCPSVRVQGPLLLPCPVRDVCPVTCPGATSLAVSCA